MECLYIRKGNFAGQFMKLRTRLKPAGNGSIPTFPPISHLFLAERSRCVFPSIISVRFFKNHVFFLPPLFRFSSTFAYPSSFFIPSDFGFFPIRNPNFTFKRSQSYPQFCSPSQLGSYTKDTFLRNPLFHRIAFWPVYIFTEPFYSQVNFKHVMNNI